MELVKLLDGLTYSCSDAIAGNSKIEISEVVYDSRKICQDCMFICVKGAKFDGHDAIDEAISKGAKAIVVEGSGYKRDGAIFIETESTRYAMAIISANVYGRPADKLITIGITGTKGKTTTTYLVKKVLESAGYKVGLVGTIEIITGKRSIHAVNTTPESYVLQEYFKEMVENDVKVVVMEVSSQGLMMHRTAGITFDYGIFTNLEADHIGPNEHKDFDDYLNCKAMLFKQCKVGIVNGDDKHVSQILNNHTCKVETFGFNEGNDIVASNVELWKESGVLGIAFKASGLVNMNVKAALPGNFSVYNVLTALAICRHFNVEEDKLKNALLEARVKGRIEIVKVSNTVTIIIDYAHNAMALESILTTLRKYDPGRLVCLFGCGGNRSRDRRFEMGEVSGRLSDLTIITSDNPRDEEPEAIIDDIITGISKTSGEYIRIADRIEAIEYSITHAKDGDVIVLAGKGHEDYQEIKGVKYPMDERVIVDEMLKKGVKPGKY